MWIDVKEELPDNGEIVFIKTDKNEFGTAEYNKVYGFEASYDAFDIFIEDDCGLCVTITGKVTQWIRIPK